MRRVVQRLCISTFGACPRRRCGRPAPRSWQFSLVLLRFCADELCEFWLTQKKHFCCPPSPAMRAAGSSRVPRVLVSCICGFLLSNRIYDSSHFMSTVVIYVPSPAMRAAGSSRVPRVLVSYVIAASPCISSSTSSATLYTKPAEHARV